eukprot:10321376-Alexandrium_andersonii.AAC.1
MGAPASALLCRILHCLRICTYNVLSLRAPGRIYDLDYWFSKAGLHVVALQGTRERASVHDDHAS